MFAHGVDGLDRWPSLTGEIEALGARHAGYGVDSDHYAPVGEALLATLREALGEQLSDEAEDAWRDFYTEISLVMERGARRSFKTPEHIH